jgi:hypothetical protein
MPNFCQRNKIFIAIIIAGLIIAAAVNEIITDKYGAK